MSESPQRFGTLRRVVAAGVLCGSIAAAGLVVNGVVQARSSEAGSSPVWGVSLIALVGLICGSLLVGLWALLTLLIKMEATTFRSYDVLRELQAAGREHSDSLRTIADSVELTEFARDISHRNKERTVLRLAINEEIIRGDWEAAYALVEQLEARHGYKNEAARLRAEVDKSRTLSQQRAVHEAVEHVKKHMEAHDWDRARREMDDLIARQPNHAEIRDLPAAFNRARDEHKRRLLKAWDTSVQRNEIDRGIAVLKELDQYLTPNEAAALKESARGVFQAKLHNLGVQFSLCATEGDWQKALQIGKQITDEFPNTRMAHEVRERFHILSKRADEQSAETVSQA